MVWWLLGCGSSPVEVASTPSAPPPPVPASPAWVSLYTGVAWDVVRWEMTAEEAEAALVQRGLPTHRRLMKGAEDIDVELDDANAHIMFDAQGHLDYVAIHSDGAADERRMIAQLDLLSARFGAPVDEERSRVVGWGGAVTLRVGQAEVREEYDGRGGIRPEVPQPGRPVPRNIGWGRLAWATNVHEAEAAFEADGFEVTTRHLDDCGLNASMWGCGHLWTIDFHRGDAHGTAFVDDRGWLSELTVEETGPSIAALGRRREGALTRLLGSPDHFEERVDREWRDDETRASMLAWHDTRGSTWSYQIGFNPAAAMERKEPKAE